VRRKKPKLPNIRRVNTIRAIGFAAAFVSMPAAALFGLGFPEAIYPAWAIVFGLAIGTSRTFGLPRPCGHMAIGQGGALGFWTPFIHRTCPMCGDRIEDAPPRMARAR